MERVSLSAVLRPETGKNAVKRVRKAGLVPAVLYGRDRPPVPLAIDRRALVSALHTEAGRNVVIDLQVKRDGTEASDTVMIAEIQHDYIRRQVLHVDLHHISLTEKIEVPVPILLTGVPEGVADGGGILEQHLRELVVRCLPTAIPEHVTVNVQGLRLGASLHVRDLPPATDVEVVTPPEEVIAAVVAPKEEEVAAPAAAATPAEPELVGKEAAPAPEGEAGAQAKAPKAEAKPSAAPGGEAQGSPARAGGAAGKPRGGDKPGKSEKKE
jgi:large subunit ribosomal protein L25